ncbi:MAG: protease modulator HflC [Proteobacteria bacterium]|nr:protease modulator HflC [Pseudomonadota bacterium]
MKTTFAVAGIAVIVAAVLAFGALFTINQTEQGIVLQLGEPVRVVTDPGLHVKLPFIQNVVRFDKRTLDLDPPNEQVILSDQRRINVDAFARYRIIDPLRFYQSVTNEARLRDRFGATLNSAVRNVAGQQTLSDLLSARRDDIMQRITEQVVAAAGNAFGIEIVDVRIGRSELPEDISQNVYDRMRSEREQEANLLRAEGDEIKLQITSGADRERIVILAEANKQSEIVRGTGEAQQTRILSEAHMRGPDFYSFLRHLEAYRRAIGADDTTLVLSPHSDFFRYFQNREGGAAGAGVGARSGGTLRVGPASGGVTGSGVSSGGVPAAVPAR